METISVPFVASYGSTALDALGDDRLTVTGGSVVVLGNAGAAVEVRGIARVTSETLEIEYRATRVQILGFISAPDNTDLQRVTIPLDAVDSIHLKGGIFRKARLIVEFSRLDIVPAIPWSDTTRVVLQIDRKDRERAREFEVSTRMMLADAQLKRLGES